MSTGQPNFYDQVYDFVSKVPEGMVVTYGQVAVLLVAPTASRAVGYALKALPADSMVPWWRVINRRDAISFKGRGPGADLQRELLEAEGVRFAPDGTCELHSLRWTHVPRRSRGADVDLRAAAAALALIRPRESALRSRHRRVPGARLP